MDTSFQPTFLQTDPDLMNKHARNPQRVVSVAALCIPDGRILLVRTHRLPNYWQPIGGGVAEGDATPADAAVREIKEEIGYDVDKTALEFSMTSDYDLGDGVIYFFKGRLPTAPLIHLRGGEILEAKFFTLTEALSLPALPATHNFLKHLHDEA